VPALLGVEPGPELVHHRLALRLPHLEVLGRAEEVRVERGPLDPLHVEDEVHRRLRGLRRSRLGVDDAATEVREAGGALSATERRDLL
jgi:hypothetical protein